MMKLYDSAFSPFARKVRMVLEHKVLNFEAVDGLLKSNHAALEAVNGRIEVPALIDGDIVVVNSPDIVSYLEFRYPLSVADIALFPHIASAKAIQVEFSPHEHPHLASWFKRMRALPICAADLQRARDFVANVKEKDVERRRIFWRGDRIEWMLARGFHDWFFNEINERRVSWPGPALPAPMKPRAASG